MNTTLSILSLSFIQSLGSTCLQRGIFFLTTERLRFTDLENLALALGLGVSYVSGALLSQRAARRIGERRWLAIVCLLLFAAQAAMAGLWKNPAALCAILVLMSGVEGSKWPVIESYVAAGRGPGDALRSIGRFNVTWASATPVALALSGPLVAHWAGGLFVVPAAIQWLSLLLLAALPAHPSRFPDDHPDLLPADEAARCGRLLAANRWMMLASYAAMFVLAPLIPGLLRGLGYGVETAAALSGLTDASRLAAFVFMGLYGGWHGRAGMAFGCIALLPAGFALILAGGASAPVILGMAVFGFVAGAIYYAALYYALVCHNAAVEAGGHHEALIGGACAMGPLAGLGGQKLAAVAGGVAAGTLWALSPIFVVCIAASIRALRRRGSESF